MAGTKRVSEVDGFTVVQLARHAKDRGAPARPASADKPTTAPAADTPAAETLDVETEITCYHCGHVFDPGRRTRLLMCPKCRKPLDQIDGVVSAPSAKSIRTVGCVRIEAGGTITGGTILARDVILEGRVESGHVRATRRLELAGGAIADESLVAAQDISVAAGTSFRFRKPLTVRNADIFGRLSADVHATGTVRIHPGGSFSGRLASRHLHVEDGGALRAELVVGRPAHRTDETGHAIPRDRAPAPP